MALFVDGTDSPIGNAAEAAADSPRPLAITIWEFLWLNRR